MKPSSVTQSGPFPDLARRLRVGPALAAGAMALLVLVGTLLGTRILAALGWGFVPMAPHAAVLVLLLVGAVLMMEARPGSAAARGLAMGAATLVALASLYLVFSHGQGSVPAFEGWLQQNWPGLQATSLLTDLALLGAAGSFLLRRLRPWAPWGLRQAAAVLAMVPETVGVLVLISYAMGAPLLYGTGQVPMSLPSAFCALTLGFSLQLAAGWDAWPLAAFNTGSGPRREGAAFDLSAKPWVLALSAAALVVVGGTFYLRGQLQATRRRVQGELKTVADLKARQIGAWFGEREGDARQIARGTLIQTQLRRFLAGSPSAPPAADLRAWLAALQQGNYRRVVLFDALGRVRMSVPSGESPTAEDLDASEVQAALGAQDVLVTDLHRHPGGTDIHMGWWVPVGAGVGGRAEGTLLLMVDPRQFLYPLIQSWPTASPSAESQLVRRDGGDVLFLNDLRHQAHTALSLRHSLQAYRAEPAVRAVLGETGLVEGRDYRGVPVLAVLNGIAGTAWSMVTKVDEAEVYGPLRQRTWMGALGLMGVLALVAGGLGVMLKHHDGQMVRRQLELTQQAEWLMREANDIILLMDEEGRILEANARAVEAYGFSRSEFLGRNILELRGPEHQTEAGAQFSQVKASGSGRFEAIHQRRDGSTFPVEVSARALPAEGGLRVLSLARDITERRVQERELLRMTQLYAALSQVNQAIVWSQGRQALFEKICEVMVEFGQCRMAWIAMNDPVTCQVRVAARHGDVHGVLDRISVHSDDSVEGHGAVGSAIRQACPCVVNDYLATPESAPWREELAAAGLISIAAFPIREGGQVCGALVVYAGEKEFFGVREAELLAEAAMDISFALDHLAGEERRQRAEAALLESERFLQAAQEAGGIGTYLWDIPGDTWKSSPYLDRIFGIDEAYPRTLQGWTDLVAPSFREQMRAYVAGIIERRERFDLDYPIIRKLDGVTRWVRGTGEFQWDGARPLALMGVIRDITERREDRAALQASEEKFSKAFHASPDAVNINRLSDGAYLDTNDGFTRITGYTAEEVRGRSSLPGDLGLWVHAEDRLRLQEGLHRDGMVEGLEALFRRKDGAVLTGLMSASLVEIEGEPCVLSITRDITQLRAQAHQLERLTQMYAALSQVNQAIVFSPTQETLLDKICEVMVVFGRFSMAWIGWNDPATHEVRVASRYGDANGYLDGIEVRSDDTVMGRGPTGRAIREGVSCVENDFLGHSESSPWQAKAARCGYAASAAFPIRLGGEVCGTLTVYSTETGFFGPHEVALLEEAASDVSFALDHLAGEAQR
ncbi:MAG: PAS domain S-box protein, partial [Geothrix sp.]|nr:PAS domain S-box protein [Geothrix sp.]